MIFLKLLEKKINFVILIVALNKSTLIPLKKTLNIPGLNPICEIKIRNYYCRLSAGLKIKLY